MQPPLHTKNEPAACTRKADCVHRRIGSRHRWGMPVRNNLVVRTRACDCTRSRVGNVRFQPSAVGFTQVGTLAACLRAHRSCGTAVCGSTSLHCKHSSAMVAPGPLTILIEVNTQRAKSHHCRQLWPSYMQRASTKTDSHSSRFQASVCSLLGARCIIDGATIWEHVNVPGEGWGLGSNGVCGVRY